MNYEQELLRFLKLNHPVVEGFQIVYDATLWPEREKQIIYENPQDQSTILVVVRGKEKGQVLYQKGEEETLLFEEMLEFVKFLELLKLEQLSKNQGLLSRITSCFQKNQGHLEKYKEEQTQEQQRKEQEKENFTKHQREEFEERKGFVGEEEKPQPWFKKLLFGKKKSKTNEEEYLTEDEFQKIVLPEKIVIDGEIIKKDAMNQESIRKVQEHLYHATYSRMEVTYLSYWERKGKKIPMYQKSLVFLCEDTKAVMYYFNDENLHGDVFYDNRDNAGYVDGDWIPEVDFHGQKVSTQHIIYDRKKLNEKLKELLFHGEIDDTVSGSTMNGGYFSIRYFSNKNAYTKYKNERGEFEQ